MSRRTCSPPLYIQLREEVRKKIENGDYPPGTAIPSENQLADAYGMHRLSVRFALKGLIQEGLLNSIQGKGIFVCGPKKPGTEDGFQPNTEELIAVPESRVLTKSVREAGPYYSWLLDIDPKDSVWYIRRIFLRDNKPLALKDTIIPCAKLPGLDEIDLRLFSLYDALNWSSISLNSADQVLRMTYLDPAIAKLLRLTPEQAIMEISCVFRDPDEHPVAYSCGYIRSDKTEFLLQHNIKESLLLF